MILLPAIDLKDGRCVRLKQGDFADATIYGDNPMKVAEAFLKAGASALHVVDLDGARDGATRQTALISQLAGIAGLLVQAGGGLRSWEDVERLFRAGASRVVLGSLAVTHVKETCEILERAGRDRVVLALDVKIDSTNRPLVVTHGWQKSAGVSLWDVLDEYVGSNLRYVLCTDVGRDGMLTGPNVSLYRTLGVHYPELSLIASGGIGSLDDLRALKKAGIFGAVIGKALYEKRFSFEEALLC